VAFLSDLLQISHLGLEGVKIVEVIHDENRMPSKDESFRQM